MLTNINKRKSLSCVTNNALQNIMDLQKRSRIDASLLMPKLTSVEPKVIYLQNKHPMLAMYKDDLVTEDLLFAQLNELLNMDNEQKVLTFLSDLGF